MGRIKVRMTPRWELVLRFIQAYKRIHGVSPSYQVMAEGLGMRSRSNMHRIVRRLREEGYLEIRRGIYGIDPSVKEVLKL